VILFSGRPASELAELAEEFGADGVMPKSEDVLQLVARVQTWIAQRQALRIAREGRDSHVATRSASASAH